MHADEAERMKGRLFPPTAQLDAEARIESCGRGWRTCAAVRELFSYANSIEPSKRQLRRHQPSIFWHKHCSQGGAWWCP